MGSKVAEAYVEIGGDKTRLQQAFRASESLQHAALARMGKELGAFSQRFAGAFGLNMFTGAVGGAVVGGALVKGLERQQEQVKQTATLMQVMGERGKEATDMRQALTTIREFQTRWGRVLGLTTQNITAAAKYGAELGLAGEELRKFLEAAAGLAVFSKRTMPEAAEALRDVYTKGGNLQDFGVSAQGLPADIYSAGERVGRRRLETIKRTGPLPGTFTQRMSAEISEAFDATAEMVGELIQTMRTDAMARKQQAPTGPGRGLLPSYLQGAFNFLTDQARLQRQGRDVARTLYPWAARSMFDTDEERAMGVGAAAGELVRDETGLTSEQIRERRSLGRGPGLEFQENVKALETNTEAIHGLTEQLRETNRQD